MSMRGIDWQLVECGGLAHMLIFVRGYRTEESVLLILDYRDRRRDQVMFGPFWSNYGIRVEAS